MIVYYNGVPVDITTQLPPVDEMRKIISYYILKKKGVRVIPVINESSSPQQVDLFCKAYLIAVNNLN